ncbi:S-layer homology domain-containing protein [Paenibacillus sp. OV219]|uniref:S-layer homology domain-containing protein n=1 Tax=Paenibacillus sp. OV219 TaxID=1884377 RepID=UPI0008D88C16|nr:S-layer homology domain-containing protein [Paenibacillus sp. OV219]SEO39631.1 S-layer homology domain-containing protein [Paenibacillus sp. OV219]
MNYIQRMKKYGITVIAFVTLSVSQLDASLGQANAAAATGSPSVWAQQEIQDALTSGLIPYGLTNSYQKPLTRQEFSEMAVQLYEVLTGEKPPAPKADPFKDTNSYPVLQAYSLGIVKGTSANTFAPSASITREQLSLMLYNTLAIAGMQGRLTGEQGAAPVFADAKQVAAWSKDAVTLLAANGIMKGNSYGSLLKFMPRSTTTREQSIVLVYRIYTRFGTYFVKDELDLLNASNQTLPVVIKDERARAVDVKAKQILANILKPDMTEYDRELAIHNYLLQHIAYDYDNYENNTVPADSYTIYGSLMKGIAVCQGYAYSAQLLLTMAGIESNIVTGSVDGVAHAWNKVRIGGAYYNLDVTWDDPVPDVEGRLTYGYFNVTDEELHRDHVWSDQLPKATAIIYNYYTYNGLTVDTPQQFEERIEAAIRVKADSITLKRQYADSQGANAWSPIMQKHAAEISGYSYTMDKSGVVSFKFRYR